METKIPHDITRLKQDGTASAREVREFIGRMKGKSPQEVLGMVAQSNLSSATIVATLCTFAFIAFFTVVPYLMNNREVEKTAVTAPNVPAATTTNATSATEQPPPETTAPSLADGPTQPNTEILEKLDMDEVKTSDPSSNPLEEKEDDLLKELR